MVERLGPEEAEPLPSQHQSSDGWLWYTNFHDPPPAGREERDPALCGKFFLFGGLDHIWPEVVRAIRDGELPHVCQAKATAGLEADAGSPSKRSGVICIYTPDFTDNEAVGRLGAAVWRLREELHMQNPKNGGKKPPSVALSFKTDNMTRMEQSGSYYHFKDGVLLDVSDMKNKRRVWPPLGEPPLVLPPRTAGVQQHTAAPAAAPSRPPVAAAAAAGAAAKRAAAAGGGPAAAAPEPVPLSPQQMRARALAAAEARLSGARQPAGQAAAAAAHAAPAVPAAAGPSAGRSGGRSSESPGVKVIGSGEAEVIELLSDSDDEGGGGGPAGVVAAPSPRPPATAAVEEAAAAPVAAPGDGAGPSSPPGVRDRALLGSAVQRESAAGGTKRGASPPLAGSSIPGGKDGSSEQRGDADGAAPKRSRLESGTAEPRSNGGRGEAKTAAARDGGSSGGAGGSSGGAAGGAGGGRPDGAAALAALPKVSLKAMAARQLKM